MALPDTIAAYSDCLEHFERAQESPRGIRIFNSTERSAIYLRNRLNQARSIERRESRKLYPFDHPSHGKSLNDRFVIRIMESAEGDGHWVYIEPWSQTVGEIEEL